MSWISVKTIAVSDVNASSITATSVRKLKALIVGKIATAVSAVFTNVRSLNDIGVNSCDVAELDSVKPTVSNFNCNTKKVS